MPLKLKWGNGNWLHGEAVAAGMVMAARTSERLGQFSSAETRRIITLLTRAGLPVNGPREIVARAYLPAMLRQESPCGRDAQFFRWQLVRVKFAAAFRTSLFLTPLPIVNQRNNKKVRPLIKRSISFRLIATW